MPPAAHEGNGELSQEERNWAAALHGAGGAGLLCYFAAIPFVNIVAPLVIWLIKREQMPFVKSEGKEVLNFHISWSLYALVIGLVLGAIGLLLTLILIGFVVLWALGILGILYAIGMVVLSIIGTMSAADGKPYRYPMTIRFIK